MIQYLRAQKEQLVQVRHFAWCVMFWICSARQHDIGNICRSVIFKRMHEYMNNEPF